MCWIKIDDSKDGESDVYMLRLAGEAKRRLMHKLFHIHKFFSKKNISTYEKSMMDKKKNFITYECQVKKKIFFIMS